MAPRVRKTRECGQRPISDFFTPAGGPSSPIDRNKNRLNRKPLSSHIDRVTNAKDNSNRPMSSRMSGSLSSYQKRTHGRAKDVNSRSTSLRVAPNTSTPNQNSRDSQPQQSPLPLRRSSRSRSSVTQRSPAPISSKELNPVEMEVQQQLQSLDCSLEGKIPTANSSNLSPISRRSFSFAAELDRNSQTSNLSHSVENERKKLGVPCPMNVVLPSSSDNPPIRMKKKNKDVDMAASTHSTDPSKVKSSQADVTMTIPKAEITPPSKAGEFQLSKPSFVPKVTNSPKECVSPMVNEEQEPKRNTKKHSIGSGSSGIHPKPIAEFEESRKVDTVASAGLPETDEMVDSNVISTPVTSVVGRFTATPCSSNENTIAPSTPCATDVNPSDKSTSDCDVSDDDDNDLYGINEAIFRRSERLGRVPERFDPSSKSGSVFGSSAGGGRLRGDVFSTSGDLGRTQISDTKRLLRECARWDKSEEELKKMREGVENGNVVLDEAELGFKNMAEGEEDMTQKEIAAAAKYTDPLLVFFKPVQVSQLKAEYLSRAECFPSSDFSETSVQNTLSSCPVHDMLVVMHENVNKNNMDACCTALGSYVKKCCDTDSISVKWKATKILYHMCVYDEGDMNEKGANIQPLFPALVSIIVQRQRLGSKKSWLPSLCDVLKDYGAEFDEDSGDRDTTTTNTGNGDIGLDGVIRKSIEERSAMEQGYLEKSTRNLQRALRLAAVQIRCGWDLKNVIGGSGMAREGLGLNEKVVESVKVCVWLVLSRFGSYLKDEVGEVIEAAVNLVTEDWAETRLRIAKTVVTLTTRLHLHVELITYLFPFANDRCLQCSLDIGYLSLYQWCRGPAAGPCCRDVKDVRASATASAYGLEMISYCVDDVVALMESIPELSKETDVVWVNGVCRLAKQILTFPFVLGRRKKGDMGRLNEVTQKLRKTSSRVKYGIPVQEMRLAMDVLLKTLQNMCGDKQTQKELDREHLNDLTQMTF